MSMQSMAGHHDLNVVALSAVIAILVAYAALDLAGRVAASRGAAYVSWLGGGAFAMGLGIWSMHYTGMFAFRLPNADILFDFVGVVISLVAAVCASALALHIVSRPSLGMWRVVTGSVLMGLGISVMHYTGMAAMRFNGSLSYDTRLVILSVAIAILGSLFALWLAFHLRNPSVRTWHRIGGAVLMGAAICSMHYTAMSAAEFTIASFVPVEEPGVAVPSLAVIAITGAVLTVLTSSVLTSIADRRQAVLDASSVTREQERLGHEQFLRHVIDADPHLVFAKDREGRFTLANRATAAVYGTTPDSLLGKTDADLNPNAEEIDHFRRDDLSVIETGQPRLIAEERVTNATSGETRWYQTVKVPLITPDGRDQHVLGVATDITERKALEAQLRQAQKMEAIGRLAGGVAHDFNNLLTAILGHTDLLLEAPPASIDPQYRDDVAEIRKSAQRAAALTKQLLAFSRKQVLEPRVVDLNALVSNMDSLVRRLIGEDIDVRTRHDGDLAMITADPGQLEQVIMNLAVNARDAMPNGGTIIIETANVIMDRNATGERPAMPPGQYVMLSISDTGTGMTQEVQTHLFEPFFTTKRPGQGTGLGLATVYGIVKQSGGFIWVYSEVGVGTTFKLYFPPVDADAPEADVPATAAPRAATGTILVVEDEDAVRRVTCRGLMRHGYRVLEASSGAEALEVAASHAGNIDLLLTDVVMPRMSGKELAERLSHVRPGMQVLYVSGYTDAAIVRHGILDPGVRFLQKPFSADVLALKVAETLGRV